MIPQNLRPKYTIEQYLVVFSFPDIVSDEPVVRAIAVIGDDPDADALVGLPYVSGSMVAVPVLGGIAGCVYEISCETEIAGEILTYTGRLAVLPTAAVIPDEVVPLPFTLAVTTPPYVLESFSGISATASPTNARVELLTFPAGEYESNAYVVDMEVRDMRIFHTVDMGSYEPDCYVVGAEVRTMRIFETQDMGGYEPDCSVTDIVIEQIRVVLTDTQENLYIADVAVTDIEVIVP